MAGTMLLGLVALLARVHGNAVTPVEKVIGLLGQLSTKIESDGKRDASLYDKYACFCKEQADNKLYQIETSTKVIADLDAKISELDGELGELNQEISTLTSEISAKETQIKEAGETRDTEHKKYLEVAASMTFAIQSVKDAIESLKQSKGKMTAADLDLVQLKALSALAPEVSALQVMSLLQAGIGEPGEPARFKYQSNDIIGTLEFLLQKFKSYKTDLDTEEFNTKAAYDKNVLSMQNIKKFKEEEKTEKEAVFERKTEEKSAATENKNDETAAKDADSAFMGVLKDDCETKAADFDQRSQTRASELKALSDAMTALKEGAAPNWKANKKLVGLVRSTKVTKKAFNAAARDAKATAVRTVKKASAPSFLQLSREVKDTAVVKRALHVIQTAAGRLHSPVLSAASMKVLVSIDHFVKVRQIINDLVAQLEADAAAEADTKGYCDTEMSAAISKRDENKKKMEDLNAEHATETATESQLSSEIAGLSQDIADNKKAMKEMTELWDVASADNTLTLDEAAAAIAAVKQAIQILESFYDGAASLAQTGKYVPPNSDREGKTVADLAPEITEGTYHGEQDSSKGIIGMLTVILSDFERTEAAVKSKHETEESAYNEDKEENEKDTDAKKGEKTTKEGLKTDAQTKITSLEDDQKDTQKLLEESEASLKELKKMCVDGEGYEDRVADREKEIEALKEALSILENWKS